MIYAPEAIVYHVHALTFRSFWKQHFNYGRGAFRFHKTRAQRRQKRVILETKAFYLGIFRYPFLQTRGCRRALQLAMLLIAMSQGATAQECYRKSQQTRGDHR